MTARVLIDTNVLVYAHDDDEPVKQRRAQEVLLQLRGEGVLCTQVLGEFASALLTKFAVRMDAATVALQTRRLAAVYPVLGTTPDVVFEALRAVETYQMSYYDAQVWAVARMNHVAWLVTEDFQSGCEIEGVTFVNPFEDAAESTILGL